MEKFLGKFKAIADKTENLDGYFTAMKIPDEAREAMRKSMANGLVTGLAQEGEDSYKEFNDYGEYKEEFVFKLGVPVTTNIMNLDTVVSEGNGATMRTYFTKIAD